MTEHPITPPPELVQQWFDQAALATNRIHCIAALAAQWGADQELEACCEWLKKNTDYHMTIEFLRAARRPKPPSLKELALAAAAELEGFKGVDTIRRALEQLPDNE